MSRPVADVDGQRHYACLLAQDCQTGCYQTSQMAFHVFWVLQVTERNLKKIETYYLFAEIYVTVKR
jgi:hypothetical protein